MAAIEHQICEAIETITDSRISRAGFDRTIQATIVACVDEVTGKYKVKYQDNTFYAYSGDVDKKYNKNNRVYILIPGNDMTRDKTILGTVGENKEYSSTEIGAMYKKVSRNFILQQKSPYYKIFSGTQYNFNEENKNIAPLNRYGKIIYNYDDSYSDITLLKENVIKECIDNTGYIYLGAKFKTNFSRGTINGNYGMRVTLFCGKNTNTYLYSISLDPVHGIIGDYYNFIEPEYQYYVYPKPDDFIRIQRIEIFAKEFDKQINEPISESLVTDDKLDITVTELELYAANKINYSATESGIEIVYPSGNFLLKGMANMELPIKAQVYDHGKIMIDDANQFFWFKKDNSVNKTNNQKWHQYGGLGWSCLNKKQGQNWVAGNNEFIFNELEHLTLYKNKFKVVSYREVANSFITHEKEFILYNDTKRDKEIILTSNKENNSVPRAVNDLEIKCHVNGKEDNAIYQYYWEVSTENLQWIEHDNIKSDFGCEIITDNGDGLIKNINFKKLNLSNTYVSFSCTVLKTLNNETITLGTESIIITLEEKQPNKYWLDILNGDQTFLYNEIGDAATVNGTFTPKALKIQITDNEKNEIVDLKEAIETGKLTINWIIPVDPEPTLIQYLGFDEGYGVNNNIYYTALNFTLKSPYNYENLDSNNLTVEVKYNDTVLTKSTNFKFLKQGDSGTNGTQYSARILPLISSEVQSPRWIVFTTIDGVTGTFNFGPSANEYFKMNNTHCYAEQTLGTVFPFYVQLMKDSKVIYEGQAGQDTANRTRPKIDIEWEMQIKSYGSNIKDRSNFEIVKDSSFSPVTMKYKKTLYTENEKEAFSNEDLNRTPANILKCTITYQPNKKDEEIDYDEDGIVGEQLSTLDEDTRTEKEFKIYATLPIVTIVNQNSKYNINFDIKSGYPEVIYNTDACHPWYDNAHIAFISEDLNARALSCKCFIKGYSSLIKVRDGKYRFEEAKNLTLSSETKKTDFAKIVTPIYKFNGDSTTNAILIKYASNSYIHIPIDMHLNRYGLSMLNDWDGTSIEINEEGGYILAPQMGAGKKNNRNQFTGILMGDVKDDGASKTQTGLFAFNNSERTFSLMAETGLCAIGKRGRSQIIIDPNADEEDSEGNSGASGCIYSGNFFKPAALDEKTGFVKSNILRDFWYRYAKNRENVAVDDYIGDSGMLIDFSNGHIYFANGKFHLDPNGHMQCLEGHLTNKSKSIFYMDAKTGKVKTNVIDENTENYFVDLSPYRDEQGKVIKSQKYFLYCRADTKHSHEGDYSGEKVKFSVTKGGYLFSSSGNIGGFEIRDSSFTSDPDGALDKTFAGYDPVISFSTTPFNRENMSVVAPVEKNDETISFDDNELIVTDDITVNDSDLLFHGNNNGNNDPLFNGDDNNNDDDPLFNGDNNDDNDNDGGLFNTNSLFSTSRSNDSLFDNEDNDSNGEGSTDDLLFSFESVKTNVRDIKLKRQNVMDLLLAIGENFGVTKDGITYTKELYSQNSCFQKLICKDLIVDNNTSIAKNLTVKGDLCVEGNLYVEGNIVTKQNITASGVKTNSVVTNEVSANNFYVSKGATIYISDSENGFDSPYKTVSFLSIYNNIFNE